MKRSKLLSLLLCLTVMLSMCFAFSSSAYAAQETQSKQALAAATTVDSGATIKPTKVENLDSAKLYATPATEDYSQDFTYTIKMPVKGSLFIRYAAAEPAYGCSVKVNGNYADASGTADDGWTYKMFCIKKAGKAKLTVTVSGKDGYAGFIVYYASGAKTVGKNSEFLLGSPGSSGVSTFKVKVPSTGYLKIIGAEAFNSLGVKLRAKGFKDWVSLSSYSNDFTTYVGVKKGTYTIKMTGAGLYAVKVQFVKKAETSARTTKKKAALIKKKKINRGVIATDKKKVHWYKIKNPKKQKMTIVVNAQKMSAGGSTGKLKVTIVYPTGSKDSTTVKLGASNDLSVTYSTTYGKANKGTYYLKVESVDGANGYYTLKWK